MSHHFLLLPSPSCLLELMEDFLAIKNEKLFAMTFVLEVEVSGFFVRSVCFSKRCHLLCMCILLCDLRVLQERSDRRS